jgi:hypothetical protein
MNIKKIGGSAAATLLAASGFLIISSPAWAACSLGADPPNSNVNGTGSRSGCGGTVTLTVNVRHDKTLLPDPIVGTAKRTNFGNGSLTANGSCDGDGNYHTETISSSGNKINSGSVHRC